MTQEVFLRGITTILTFKQIKINKGHNTALYKLMQSDFDDKEFLCICEKITKLEFLYNKYPDPALFYQYKTKTIQEQKDEFRSKQIEQELKKIDEVTR